MEQVSAGLTIDADPTGKLCRSCKVAPAVGLLPTRSGHTRNYCYACWWGWAQATAKALQEGAAVVAALAERTRRSQPFRQGLTVGQAEDMFAIQAGRCAACGDPISLSSNATHVDHDHRHCPQSSCGQCVGGLLCRNCNHAAGQAKDDPDRLKAIAAYLRRVRKEDYA